MSWHDELDTEMEHAWAAGMLDARGRWMVIPRKGWAQSYSPRIVIPLRRRPGDLLLGERMVALFGGTISKPRTYQRQWQVSGAKGCARVNAAVMHHLRRAGPIAKAHQHLCLRIVEFKRASFDDRRLPDEELEVRRRLREAFAKAERKLQF